jgi:hypothetical protein
MIYVNRTSLSSGYHFWFVWNRSQVRHSARGQVNLADLTTLPLRHNDPSNQRSLLSASKQRWPTATCLPSAWPVVFYLRALTFLYVARHTVVVSSGLCNLATARFDVWSSYEKVSTALQSSARAGVCYVTRSRGLGTFKSRSCHSCLLQARWGSVLE